MLNVFRKKMSGVSFINLHCNPAHTHTHTPPALLFNASLPKYLFIDESLGSKGNKGKRKEKKRESGVMKVLIAYYHRKLV